MLRHKTLITGGAGFIGSNLIKVLLESSDSYIVNLDKLTYASDYSYVEKYDTWDNYAFAKADICNRSELKALFEKHQFTRVIHLAAESHVDNSITGPEVFIDTNIKGTFNLLQEAYSLWMDGPNQLKEGFSNARFLHVSTDEVYGTLGKTGLFTEETPYAPNSPYSASKAASDMLVRSYFHTYGLPVVTTNCSNNYGPHQHDEKLIPVIIKKAIKGDTIPIYGDGQNIRDWLFVDDHARGILLAIEQGTLGETYNIGGHNERTNLYIATKICEILDQIKPKETAYKEQISFVTDRPGHDFRYAIDASKIEKSLGWKAQETFETGILKTVHWYLNKYTA